MESAFTRVNSLHCGPTRSFAAASRGVAWVQVRGCKRVAVKMPHALAQFGGSGPSAADSEGRRPAMHMDDLAALAVERLAWHRTPGGAALVSVSIVATASTARKSVQVGGGSSSKDGIDLRHSKASVLPG